jgi:hypothetical protein
MPVNAEQWTQDKIFTRVRKDLDLEAETFYRDELMTEALNSAITDCEQLVIDEYQDYLLVYKDYDITQGQSTLTLPDDIYQCRIRWMSFKLDGFDQPNNRNTSDAYTLRKIPLEDLQSIGPREPYRYRLINFNATGPQLEIYPNFRGEDSGTAKVRLWYIRHFKRLYQPSDVTDVPIPEYLLAHLRISIMEKEGNPMLPDEQRNLDMQTRKLQKTLKFLSDDEEDEILQPNWDTLSDFGDNDYYDVVRR